MGPEKLIPPVGPCAPSSGATCGKPWGTGWSGGEDVEGGTGQEESHQQAYIAEWWCVAGRAWD